MPDTTPIGRRAALALAPAGLAAGFLALLAGPAAAITVNPTGTRGGQPLPNSHRFHGRRHRQGFRDERARADQARRGQPAAAPSPAPAPAAPPR